MTDSIVPSVQDDNLLSRRKAIKDSLNNIKDKKVKILNLLNKLHGDEQIEPEKEMTSKLVESFDLLSSQEAQYLRLYESIVNIHTHATEDIATDMEDKIKECEQNQIKKAENGEEKDETKEENKETTDEKEETEEDVMAELKATMEELEAVSKAAVAASLMNEQLVEKLQHTRNQKNQLTELRKDKDTALLERAQAVLTDVEKTRNQVLTEKSETAKKNKQLEDLRKEALKMGMQLGEKEEQQKEAVVRAVEAMTDDVVRIPPITKPEENKPELDEETLEERRKQIRENVRKERERKEQVNKLVREKLAAMKARNERMKAIRIALSNDGSNKTTDNTSADSESSMDASTLDDPRLDLEATFRTATLNLQNLTNMRQRLEEMQRRGEDITDEDANLIDRIDSVGFGGEEEETIKTTQNSDVTESS